MLNKKHFYSLLFASSLSLLNADSFSLNVNNNTFEVSGENYIEVSNNFNNPRGLNIKTSFFHSEDKEDNTENIYRFGAKFFDGDLEINRKINIGFGTNLVVVDTEKQDLNAVTLNLYGNINLNNYLSIDGSIGYSPKIMTFDDGEGFREAKVNINYKINKSGYIYAGIRNITADYTKDISRTFDNSLYFGFKATY